MRRRLSVALAAWAFAGACHAQAWPSKPVRVIVPFAPGGPVDIIARIVGAKLNETLGQQFVVENRAGAGGNIGAAAAAKSASDGYTVLMTSSAIVVNASLYPDPGYDAERDFIAVAIPASQPNMIFVNSSVQARTLPELISQSRGKKIAFASPGSGTTPHLTGENILRVIAKLDVTPIHFRGAGLAVTAVVQGEPAEAGFPGVEDYTWVGVFVPAGTPATIVQKLNEAVNAAIRNPETRERLAASAFDPVGGPQSQAAEYMKTEIAKWGKVVRDTGAKPD